MLAELVADGFARLRDAMAAADGEGAAPADRLRRAGLAYIAFAQSSPALFRLMFASELVDPAGHPQVQAGQAAALAIVEGIVADMADPGDAADLTLAAWALVHGYATLVHRNRARAARPPRGARRLVRADPCGGGEEIGLGEALRQPIAWDGLTGSEGLRQARPERRSGGR